MPLAYSVSFHSPFLLTVYILIILAFFLLHMSFLQFFHPLFYACLLVSPILILWFSKNKMLPSQKLL